MNFDFSEDQKLLQRTARDYLVENAPLALCRKVLELHALTDYATGTTANVGLIRGGQSVNTVAPLAAAELDVRFKTVAAMHDAEAADAK